jgi:signal transduction histidine kinase
MNVELHNSAGLFISYTLARLFRCDSRFLELGLVDAQAEFLRHETREIDGETIGVVQTPHVLAAQRILTSRTSLLDALVKKLLTTIQSAGERGFLLVQERLNLVRLLSQFREYRALYKIVIERTIFILPQDGHAPGVLRPQVPAKRRTCPC